MRIPPSGSPLPQAIVLALLCLFVAAADEVPATVTGNNLRVRCAPRRSAEVLCLLKADAQITVVKFERPWLGIKPPEQISAWVPKDALKDGQVARDEVPVRDRKSVV